MLFGMQLSQLQILVVSGLMTSSALSAFAAGPAARPADIAENSSANKVQAAQSYGKLPLSFETNQGQADNTVKFLTTGRGYTLFLTDSSAVLALSKQDSKQSRLDRTTGRGIGPSASARSGKTDILRMEFAGANRSLRVMGDDKLPGTANYFIGNDPAQWRSGVPTYGKVRYSGVYPGVDLVFYGNQRQLEYDFVLAPGANPKPIRLQFAGAKKLKLTAGGDLTIATVDGKIVFHKPVLYQVENGNRRPVEGKFSLVAKGAVGFKLGKYDHTKSLVIDPVLAYSTYFGTDISVSAIAVDGQGNAYITGTSSPSANVYGGVPVTSGAFHTAVPSGGYTKAYVTKLNPTGTALVYSTYLGGSASDEGVGIAVDNTGDAYVTGLVNSTDFPVTAGAFQTLNNARGLDPFGSDYAIFTSNAFVTKLNPTGTALIYSTYLGGSGVSFPDTEVGAPGYTPPPYFTAGDYASSIAVDGSGNAYVTGMVNSTDFPVTQGAFQAVNNSRGWVSPNIVNPSNAFIAKLNPSGTALSYSTYLGGSGDPGGYAGDAGSSIAVDGSGNAYVTGYTSSSDFPVTSNAFQTKNKAATEIGNAFVTKINQIGTELLYSTYLGGSASDSGLSVAVDGSGNAYVTGSATSKDFPVTAGAFQTVNNATGQNSNAFVTKLNSAGSLLLYSTYLGGSGGSDSFCLYAEVVRNPAELLDAQTAIRCDYGFGIAVDSSGDAYVIGQAESTDFPITSGAYQAANKSQYHDANAFVSKLNSAGSALLYSTYLGGSGDLEGYYGDYGIGVALDGSGSAYLTGITASTNFPVTSGAFQTNLQLSSPDVFIAKLALGTYSDPITTATATILTSTPNPSTAGQTVTFVATIRPASGTGIPTGKIISTIDGVTGPTATLVNGVATFAASTLSADNHTIVVTYDGDVNYSASMSNSLVEVVNSVNGNPTTSAALQFIPVTPCRIVDTRNATGAFGGPELASGATRNFDVVQSGCGIPSTAVAYSLNATVVPDASLGFLTLWPAGEAQPASSTLNSDGRVKANATITPAGANGGVSAYASDATQLILDIDGYFVPAGTSTSGLEFYPLTPCRIADTRNAPGALGGPSIAAGAARAFPVQSSGCGIPSTALAYSLNVTAVPHGGLNYLTTWPTGAAQPVVSTLNALTGAVTANAAIVPIGTGGDVSIYVSDAADVILDVNGYFAPPVAGGLSLYTVVPCRVVDTRNGAGAFDGTLDVAVHGSGCAPPATAQAYVLNATVVPTAPLGYLSLWAAGGTQPVVSTLNANDGAVTSNMAIVPTSNGSIDAFASSDADLILDLSSYFAP
jgi:Bacterial Ig-like domain (group 3)/Beta-propeller repeat